MDERDFIIPHTLPYEVIPGVYMLGSGMMFRVFGKGLGPFIVNVNWDWGVGT